MNFSISIDIDNDGDLDPSNIVRLSELAASAAYTININLPDNLRISSVNVASYDDAVSAPGEELVPLDPSQVHLHEVPFDPEVTP